MCSPTMIPRLSIISEPSRENLPNIDMKLGDMYPDNASGVLELTVVTVPRDIYVRFDFATNDTHTGHTALYQILF